MNRLKVWLFVLLVGAAAVAAVRFGVVSARGVATRGIDARLEGAGARLAGAVRTLSSETAAVAALAARDPKLVELLHAKEAVPPRGRRLPAAPAADPAADDAAVQAAARAAMASAEGAVGFVLPGGSQLYAANREAHARKVQDAGAADRELVEALGAAIGGETRRGFVRWSETLWYSAAVPAGEGAGLVLLVPVDASWLQLAVSGAGADLTLAVPGQKPLTTARGLGADALLAAGRGVGAARDAGRLAPAPMSVLGFRMAKAPLLFLDGAPSHRVLPIGVPGLPAATAVASAPTAAALVPIVEAMWTALVLAAALLLIGLLVGVLVRPAEAPPPVPPELLAAADKIGRGDFTARAPALAGKLGTVAAALNRAVDAAAAAASPANVGSRSLTQEFFAGGEKAAPAPAEADPSAFEFPARAAPAPSRPAPAPEPAPAALAEAPALGGGAFEAAPVPSPRTTSVITPPPPSPAPAPAAAAAPELLQAAARAAPPAEAGGEEQHWREVFHEFLRVRTECGEPAEGLTFERFRAKLESNKATLVTKYACRTVRFQVYVKEGKAALKATPVR